MQLCAISLLFIETFTYAMPHPTSRSLANLANLFYKTFPKFLQIFWVERECGESKSEKHFYVDYGRPLKAQG